MSLLRRFLSSTGVCLLAIGAGVCPARPAAAREEVRPQLMPPHPDVQGRIAAAGYDSVTMVSLARLADVKRSKGIDQAGPIRAPVTGTRPALVLLVEYSDLTANGASTSAFYNNLLFTDGTYPSPGSMRDYYQEVSYGVFDISPSLVDSAWRQTSNAHNYYADADGIPLTADDYGFGTYPQNAQGLVVDAVTLADPYVDFSSFAVSGQVQGLFVIHAGRGAETDPTHYDWIWSHQWGLNAYAMTVDGVTVNLYSMEPEYSYSAGDSTVGVFCHEYGHVLGLPDLYDYDGSSAGVGDWSLMAGGSWNGPGGSGGSPAQPDAWCKVQLGWVTPTIVTTSVTGASIARAEDNAVAYQLWTNGTIGTEYFLLENRQQVLFDTWLPSDGLFLYHVDELVPDNDNDWHPKVMVEQADGLWDLQYGYNYGDTGDPYPGSSVNRTANASTTPNTRSYSSADTHVSISNISDSATTMTADISVEAPIAMPEVLLEVHPNERAPGQVASQFVGGAPWTQPTTSPHSSYVWKKYVFAGSDTLWIQVCSQNMAGWQQSGHSDDDNTWMTINGSMLPDYDGIQQGNAWGWQWRGSMEQGQRWTLRFLWVGGGQGTQTHNLWMGADESPVLWWIKVTDLEPQLVYPPA